jgi:FdrA protein
MNYILAKVLKNTYKDSMQLMQVTERAKKVKGVIDAAAVMATENNKELLRTIKLLNEEGERANADDILLVVLATGRDEAEFALQEMEKFVMQGIAAPSYIDLKEALNDNRINLAVISVPGEHAREVALPIIERGISVHLFSDHVSIEDEVYLKKLAIEKGVLLLGPSAGTSILGGKGIAFANAVRRGRIGIVSASGTGLQEVSVLISHYGEGISQGFGVGGRDLSDSCMGMMTKRCIEIFEEDEQTDVVCIISKPAGEDALKELIKFIKNDTKKDYVLCLLGSEELDFKEKRIVQANSLHAAAGKSMKLLGKDMQFGSSLEQLLNQAKEIKRNIADKSEFIRGLFTGGTLAYESMIILQDGIGDIFSNIAIKPENKLKDPFKSFKHTVIDLGEEEFTEGRLHPMIDPTVRNIRLKQEMNDKSVGLIMMDVMLGYASNADPAGAIINTVNQSKSVPPIIAHVCGTEQDPQGLNVQTEKLKSSGINVFTSNAEMSFVAAAAFINGNYERAKIIARKYLLV